MHVLRRQMCHIQQSTHKYSSFCCFHDKFCSVYSLVHRGLICIFNQFGCFIFGEGDFPLDPLLRHCLEQQSWCSTLFENSNSAPSISQFWRKVTWRNFLFMHMSDFSGMLNGKSSKRTSLFAHERLKPFRLWIMSSNSGLVQTNLNERQTNEPP